ncbi:MAG: hypothetical protein MZV64_10140 [Ignavibacteriales bacterium]|nr:hypothetical protein [Ignavibacteriales bacterium]
MRGLGQTMQMRGCETRRERVGQIPAKRKVIRNRHDGRANRSSGNRALAGGLGQAQTGGVVIRPDRHVASGQHRPVSACVQVAAHAGGSRRARGKERSGGQGCPSPRDTALARPVAAPDGRRSGAEWRPAMLAPNARGRSGLPLDAPSITGRTALPEEHSQRCTRSAVAPLARR